MVCGCDCPLDRSHRTFLVEANGQIKGCVASLVSLQDISVVLQELHECERLAGRAVLAGEMERRISFIVDQTDLHLNTYRSM